jgi:hypothetical protein
MDTGTPRVGQAPELLRSFELLPIEIRAIINQVIENG